MINKYLICYFFFIDKDSIVIDLLYVQVFVIMLEFLVVFVIKVGEYNFMLEF